MTGGDNPGPDARLPGAATKGERRPGLRPAGALGSRIAGPIVARRGGGALARLKSEWAAIVGGELAAASWPQSLGRDGALKLLVAPALALELQHRAPLLLDRINQFFGRGVAFRLVLVQGPLPIAAAPTGKAGAAPLTDAEESALGARLDGVADPELRAALAGLGRLVLAGRRG